MKILAMNFSTLLTEGGRSAYSSSFFILFNLYKKIGDVTAKPLDGVTTLYLDFVYKFSLNKSEASVTSLYLLLFVLV